MDVPTKFTYTPVERVGRRGAVIKVIGVGGGGGSVVNYMATQALDGTELIVANTDTQDLDAIPDSVQKIQLGVNRTEGLGAGMDPRLGRAAAEESRTDIEEQLRDANMVFVVACMGGGTGSGASPIIAELAKEKGILTVGVVTRPFTSEQIVRRQIAERGIREIHENVNALLTIPNDKLHNELGGDTPFRTAFNYIDAYLANIITSIADIVHRRGQPNLDFRDISNCLVMRGNGVVVMGTGVADGPNRAEDATERALKNPLLEDVDLGRARNVLFNVTAKNMSLDEWDTIASYFDNLMSSRGRVFPGAVEDPDMEDDAMKVTVLLAGVQEDLGMPQDHVDPFTAEFESNGRDFSNRIVKAPTFNASNSSENGNHRSNVETPNISQITTDRRIGRRLDISDIPSLFKDGPD